MDKWNELLASAALRMTKAEAESDKYKELYNTELNANNALEATNNKLFDLLNKAFDIKRADR